MSPSRTDEIVCAALAWHKRPIGQNALAQLLRPYNHSETDEPIWQGIGPEELQASLDRLFRGKIIRETKNGIQLIRRTYHGHS